jgi:hypothetical protein
LCVRFHLTTTNRHPFIWGDIPSDRPTTLDVIASANGAIIGNKKIKIYHRLDYPGAMRVSAQNRVRFATEAEAQAAGYRMAVICPEVLFAEEPPCRAQKGKNRREPVCSVQTAERRLS